MKCVKIIRPNKALNSRLFSLPTSSKLCRSRMLSNKVILITGASSGIGAGTAVMFAKLNSKLVLTGRNENNLAKVAKECENISPDKLKPVTVMADITKEADVNNLVKQTLDNFGHIDVLINNAGIMSIGSIENTSLEQYDEVLNTNLRSHYYITMLLIPYLIETKGNIVNVSSVGGLKPYSGVLAYCVAKSALDEFTRCLSEELASKGVRVNSVNPGSVKTNIYLRAGVREDDYKKLLIKAKEKHPLGRIVTTEEVANTIIFLASDLASNITGATIPVDGGRHILYP